MLLRCVSGNRGSVVRNIPNRRLESCVITKPQCLSIFRFELQQGFNLKVQGGSGYSCHALRGMSAGWFSSKHKECKQINVKSLADISALSCRVTEREVLEIFLVNN